jgi:hypothetical protein
LAPGNLASQSLTILGEGDHGRGQPTTFRIGDDHRVTALHDGHNRVSRSEVDPNHLSHGYPPVYVGSNTVPEAIKTYLLNHTDVNIKPEPISVNNDRKKTRDSCSVFVKREISAPDNRPRHGETTPRLP